MSGSSSVIGTVSSNGLERRCNPVCLIRAPNRVRSELPGIKLTTYRTQGSPREHGNLQSSARKKHLASRQARRSLGAGAESS